MTGGWQKKALAPVITSVLAFVLLVMSSGGALADSATVTDIRVGEHPDKTRLVLEMGQRPDFDIFALIDPIRIVIDLQELAWPKTTKALPPRSGVIGKYRFGLFTPGTSRVVIDLKEPASVAQAFVIPPREGHGYRLVVDLAKTDIAQFTKGIQARKNALEIVDAPRFERAAPNETALTLPADKAAIPSSRDKDTGRVNQTVSTPDAAKASVENQHVLIPLPVQRPHPFNEDWQPTIVIDAGHGGVDPGAISPKGLYEKTLTLDYAKVLRKALQGSGRYKVVLTREDDRFIRLRDRILIAQEQQGDLFISLHANTHPSKKVKGASVYTLSETASDAEAEALAAKENKADIIAGIDFNGQNEMVSQILIDLAQRETMNLSKHYANMILAEMQSDFSLLVNPHRFAGFAVLKSPTVPSILIEVGYLSHPREEKQISSAAYKEKFAAAVVRAIDAYFEKQLAFKKSP